MRLMWGLLAVGLAGCNPTEPGGSNSDEVSETVDGTTSGDSSLPLTISRMQYTEATPGPVMVVLETELPTQSDIQLSVNGILVKEESIPASCQVLPAVTVCDDTLFKRIPLILETAGALSFEVVVMKGERWRSETFTETVEQAGCSSNQTVYEQDLQPRLQQSCENCHGNGNAGVFDADDDWATIRTSFINRGDAFYRYPSGQDVGHDARPFNPYDATYRLMAEMIWRVENDFSCS